MDKAFTKEQWLDFMDVMDAFGVKVSGPRGELFVVAFSDGFEFFGRNHWSTVIESWEDELLLNVVMGHY